MSHVIALVDDDRNILTSVSIALQSEGFVTRVYTDGAAALKAFAENLPDLGVFDIKMPQMDGMEMLRRLREFSSMPVIFLTSKDDELDEALGLAMGADDYITKPFSQRLLLARIRAILRRQELAKTEAAPAEESEPEMLVRGRLSMDPARHKVKWDGRDVTLTVSADGGLDFKLADLSLEDTKSEAAATPAGEKDGHWYDVQTKFDLAKAYQEMGDKDGAKEILQEVLKEGDAEQKAQAKTLMDSLG